MNIEMKVTVSKFDDAAFIEAVRAAVQEGLLRAARKFLIAVVTHSDFRIFTGFTRGAFRNLEDVVGRVRADASAAGGFKTRAGSKGLTGLIPGAPGNNRTYYYYPPGGGRVRRTPDTGRGFSTTGKNNIFSIARGKYNFYFRFNVDITYFTRSHWGQDAWYFGEQAFFLAIDREVHLPDPLKYITERTI